MQFGGIVGGCDDYPNCVCITMYLILDCVVGVKVQFQTEASGQHGRGGGMSNSAGGDDC